MWENRLLFPNGKFAKYQQVDRGRYFTLRVKGTKHKILHVNPPAMGIVSA